MLAKQSSSARASGTTDPKRHFNIVVAGEFNSGKSSVLNMLLRKEVVPVSVGVSDLPPTQVVHADIEVYDLPSARSDQKFTKSDLFSGASGEKFDSINIAVPMEDFHGAAIFEVSVGQNGELDPAGQKVLAEADLLIWCTMGQRAWCLSEISIVELLPKSLLDTAILAVTRSDYLRNTEDIGKVERRLSREAREFFSDILMLDSSRKSISNISDQTVWDRSGAKELHDLVSSEFKKSPFFEKIRLVTSSNVSEIDTATQPESPLSSAEVFSAWSAELEELEKWVESQSVLVDRKFAEHVQKRLVNFSKILQLAVSPCDAQTDCFYVFDGAVEYLDSALSKSDQPKIDLLAADLTLQLLRELGSFSDGNQITIT